MTNTPRRKLPEYVRVSHGAYYYVRWNPTSKRVTWLRLADGDNYAGMLRALSELERPGERTLAAVFDRYLAEISVKASAGTQRQHRWQLKILKASFGQMAPETVRPKHVYRFLSDYGKRSESSANNCVSLLSHVFVKAIQWGVCEHNPALHIEKHKRPKRPKRYLSDAEYSALLGAAPAWCRDALELAYLTGQRIGDVLKLEWSQVGSEAITFRQQKTGTLVEVEYSPRLEAVIARCRAAKVLGRTVLADGEGQALGYRRVARAFAAAVTGAGLVPKATLHDLRRKAESDSPEDSQLLGHRDGRMKAVYRAKPLRAKPPA